MPKKALMNGSHRRRQRPGSALSTPAGRASPPPATPVSGKASGVAASPPAAPVTAPNSGTGEEAWERTHLEQTMFAMAREHADAAARCARATPPDREGEQTHSLVALLMSFLAVEAFINMVGADRLGSRYRHYDRMSPEGKWMEVTRLVSKTGKTFDEDGEDLRALSTLRTWRNMLTHYKGEYEDVQHAGRGGETKIEALLSADNAAKAVEIARNLYRAFYAFDRRSAPRQFLWLDDRQHRAPSIPGPPAPTRSPTAVRSSPARSSRPGGPPRGAAGAAAAVSGTPGIRPDGSVGGGAAPDRGSAPGAHAAAADGPHPPFGGSKPEKGQRQAEVAAGPQGALPAAPGGARRRRRRRRRR